MSRSCTHCLNIYIYVVRVVRVPESHVSHPKSGWGLLAMDVAFFGACSLSSQGSCVVADANNYSTACSLRLAVLPHQYRSARLAQIDNSLTVFLRLPA